MDGRREYGGLHDSHFVDATSHSTNNTSSPIALMRTCVSYTRTVDGVLDKTAWFLSSIHLLQTKAGQKGDRKRE